MTRYVMPSDGLTPGFFLLQHTSFMKNLIVHVLEMCQELSRVGETEIIQSYNHENLSQSVFLNYMYALLFSPIIQVTN